VRYCWNGFGCFCSSVSDWTVSNQMDFSFLVTSNVSIFLIFSGFWCVKSFIKVWISGPWCLNGAGASLTCTCKPAVLVLGVSALLTQVSFVKGWGLHTAFVAYLLSFGYLITEDEGGITFSVLFVHYYSSH